MHLFLTMHLYKWNIPVRATPKGRQYPSSSTLRVSIWGERFQDYRAFACDVTGLPRAQYLAVLVYSCNVRTHTASTNLKPFCSSLGTDGFHSQVWSLLLVVTYYTSRFSRDIALIEKSLYIVPSPFCSVYTSMAIIYGNIAGIYGKWNYRWRKCKRSI